MTDFSQTVPVNPEKPHELHDQAAMPPAPKLRSSDLIRVYTGFGLGILFALGAVALAFEARASWDSHRDWVVPMTIPLLVIGGLAMGYLAARMRLKALAPTIILVALALLFAFLNILRGAATEGQDGLRDAMSIITGVLLGAAIAWTVVAFAIDEVKNPVEPPAAEM